MGILQLAKELTVGGVCCTTLLCVGVAALEVRLALGAYEFNKQCISNVRGFIESRGQSHPSEPKYAKAEVSPFQAELDDDLEDDAEMRNYLEQHEDKEKDDEGKVVVKNVRTTLPRNRHTKGKFLKRLVADTKNHFGGTPTPTDANRLAVMKYMVGRCREHHLVDLHIRQVTELAKAAVFTPDILEVQSVQLLNSYPAYRRRCALHNAHQVQVWKELLTNCFHKDAWEYIWFRMNGGLARSPFQFHK
nr:RNA polymerase pre-readthrough protein [Calibrachoa mottle virus]